MITPRVRIPNRAGVAGTGVTFARIKGLTAPIPRAGVAGTGTRFGGHT